MYAGPSRREPANQDTDDAAKPIEDLFQFDEDPVDFMSAESFPASDPPPPQGTIDLPRES